MSYTISRESFDSLAACYAGPGHHLPWNSVFVLPAWLKVWWQEFGAGGELYLGVVRQGEKIIGMAPLLLREGRASIIGSANICDYLDFVVAPGMAEGFFSIVLDDLRAKGINQLDLESLRTDSTVLTDLVGIARNRGYEVVCQPEDVSLEIELPATWEEYLAILTTKQRHEVRRKLRRLSEAGKINYYFIQDSTAIANAMDTFLRMFTQSREDKATFLNTTMESFFRSMAVTMAEVGRLRLGVLELETLPAAMILCFVYNDGVSLYNSSYDPRYDYLSVGLLSKVLCIKESIQEGKKRFDFLKGAESYKYRLGGKEVPLYRCRITLK